MRRWIVLGLAIVAILALGACAGEDAEQTPTGTSAPPTPTATPEEHEGEEDSTDESQALFLSAGCAACHDQDAEDSAMAPALPGHSREAVLMQVRDPVGLMPAFSTTQLSDENLEKIVAYIAGLEAEHEHEMEEVLEFLATGEAHDAEHTLEKMDCLPTYSAVYREARVYL